MPKIFICYRREDSAWPAQVIHEKLEGHFGSDTVIIDIDNIPMGTDFREYLNRQVSKCDIFLAVIGDHWMKALEQRLDDADDFVRIEIQTALERKIPVVPILVGETSVPSKKKLPEKIEKLAYMQATPVRTGPDLQTHLKRLTKGLDRILAERKAEEEQRQKEAAKEHKRKEAEETKRKAEEEQKRIDAEEAKRKAEEERKQKKAEEAKRKAEEERKRKETAEAKRKAEAERKRKEEIERIEAARKVEQERKQKELERIWKEYERKQKKEEAIEERKRIKEKAQRKAEEDLKPNEAEANRIAEEKRKLKEEEKRIIQGEEKWHAVEVHGESHRRQLRIFLTNEEHFIDWSGLLFHKVWLNGELVAKQLTLVRPIEFIVSDGKEKRLVKLWGNINGRFFLSVAGRLIYEKRE